MRVLTLVGKGGGGKSTTAINVGCAARAQGVSVALADADPQRSIAQWRRVRGSADIPVAVCCPDKLDETIERARKAKIECLIIDTAPDLSVPTVAAMRAADVVLIPTKPAAFDLSVTAERVNLLRSIGRRFGIAINAAPPRREGQDSPLALQARTALSGAGVRAQLWRGQITHRHAIIYALGNGRGIVEVAPHSPAAVEYGALWDAITMEMTRRIAE